MREDTVLLIAGSSCTIMIIYKNKGLKKANLIIIIIGGDSCHFPSFISNLIYMQFGTELFWLVMRLIQKYLPNPRHTEVDRIFVKAKPG